MILFNAHFDATRAHCALMVTHRVIYFTVLLYTRTPTHTDRESY